MTTTTTTLKTEQEIIEKFGVPYWEDPTYPGSEREARTLEAVKEFMFPVSELRVVRAKVKPNDVT